MEDTKNPIVTKRLMLSFWDICFENFPDGKFIKYQLEPQRAAEAINGALANDHLFAVSNKDLAAPYEEHSLNKAKELCRTRLKSFVRF